MIKSVNNYPVSQLFDIEAGVVYAIPRYQREYTWKMDQWESLFNDIEENDPGYFLGSIMCINQTTDTLAVQRLEVVDGQQRLTTLSLLFAALYQSLKLLEKNLDDDQRVELINLKRKLVLKKGDDQLRVIPQIQNSNQNDYRAVLSDVRDQPVRYASLRGQPQDLPRFPLLPGAHRRDGEWRERSPGVDHGLPRQGEPGLPGED